MNFKDRFRNRSSVLTKSGLLVVLNVPSNPISKSNLSNDELLFNSIKNVPDFINENHHKKTAFRNSPHINNNHSGFLSSRQSYSRQSPSGVKSNRVSPHNLSNLGRKLVMLKTPSSRESNIRTNLRETSILKGLEGDVESEPDNKYERQKHRSLEVALTNKKMDFILEEYAPAFEKRQKIYREKSREEKENLQITNSLVRSAIENIEKLQIRGTSQEFAKNKKLNKELDESDSTITKLPFLSNEIGDRKPLSNINSQLEKFQNLGTISARSAFMSFRGRENQAAVHLKKYFKKMKANQLKVEDTKLLAGELKAQRIDKIVKVKQDKDQLEAFKLSFTKKEDDKKIERSGTSGRLRLPSLDREKGFGSETERTIKKVSFKEETEVLTERGNTRQKEIRLLKFDRDEENIKEMKEENYVEPN